MPAILYPGFENLTRDSQQIFRRLLEALSMPGRSLEVPVSLKVPNGLSVACAAACLTLVDLETDVWLQPGLSESGRDWLQFHTGCGFVESPKRAAFAVVHDVEQINLEQFYWGSAETPEVSTTLLVQMRSLENGPAVKLTGPGILKERMVSPDLPRAFWQQWQQNQAAYPQGVDVFLFAAQSVVGLPRTVCATVEE